MKPEFKTPGAAYRPQTAADRLMVRLRERLFDGLFAPGEVISIRQIAAAEEVSVIPARDALRGLVATGALEFRDSRTIVVPSLGLDTLEEIGFARLTVETEMADRAFARLVDRADELQALDDEVTHALIVGDVANYMRTNRMLHFAIYSAATAPTLMRIAEELWLRFGPSMRYVCESYGGTIPSPDYHAVAIAALRSGDRTGFRAAMSADIAQGTSEIERHIRASSRAMEERERA